MYDQPDEEKGDFLKLNVDIKSIMNQEEEKEKEQASSEYLVIYVHFFDRLVKRLLSKGFFKSELKILGYKTKVFNTDLSDIKMALFVDPNGLEVRLMEMMKEHLGEENASKKTVDSVI